MYSANLLAGSTHCIQLLNNKCWHYCLQDSGTKEGGKLSILIMHRQYTTTNMLVLKKTGGKRVVRSISRDCNPETHSVLVTMGNYYNLESVLYKLMQLEQLLTTVKLLQNKLSYKPFLRWLKLSSLCYFYFNPLLTADDRSYEKS